MCGIFGIFDNNKSDMFYELGKLSESRGKEASGLMVLDGSEISIKKYSNSFQNSDVKKYIKNKKFSDKSKYFGHTRLQTSGSSKHNQNNQPVETESLIVLHNGIITNYKHLNKKYSFDRNTELDTYVINELFELFF